MGTRTADMGTLMEERSAMVTAHLRQRQHTGTATDLTVANAMGTAR